MVQLLQLLALLQKAVAAEAVVLVVARVAVLVALVAAVVMQVARPVALVSPPIQVLPLMLMLVRRWPAIWSPRWRRWRWCWGCWWWWAAANGGYGGAGWNGSGVFGTEVGVSGVFAGGGGGGAGSNTYPVAGGGSGGGGDGSNVDYGTGGTGVAGTGSGGGGGGSHGNGGPGGAGAVVVAYTTADFESQGNMVLVSTATTAETAPTKGDLVFTYTNGAGTAVIGTNITAEYSADNGSTWTDFGIAAGDVQGTTGGHTIVTKHDVALTSTSGTSMKWRVKTLVQSASMDQRIHAVSLGWS